MRLIDADTLKDIIKQWLPPDPCGKEYYGNEVAETEMCVDFLTEIDNQPTIENNGVKVAEWIGNYGYEQCSECGKHAQKQSNGVALEPMPTKFCPYCGAKMRRKERE